MKRVAADSEDDAMDPERWLRIERVFSDALDVPRAEREAFLAKACSDDTELRHEVDALLEADARSEPLLDGGPLSRRWLSNAERVVERRVATAGLDPTGAVSLHETLRDAISSGPPSVGSPATNALPPLSMAEAGRIEEGAVDGPEFVVRRLLGEGGMGAVLLAWQRSLQREVAIKTVEPNARPGLAESLVAEAMITGALEHPVVPPVYALGRARDGRPVLVMKRIEGVVWSELLADDGHTAWSSLPLRGSDRLEAHLHILGRVADAVHFAHGHGVLHRDIKPDNVMVGRDGEVYLVDWGIAVRLGETASVALRGTPQLMAPEMVTGQRLDARADVFLLGATLHYVLVREPRHTGASLAEVLFNALACRSVEYPPEVPPELGRLANLATSPDRARRLRSALEFRTALESFVAHRGAVRLAEAALERVGRVERALSSAAPLADPELGRLVTEARFALVEARRLWPDGVVIAEGVRRARRVAVLVELQRENPLGAREFMTEDGEPDAELVEAIAALERGLSERAENHARLARASHDASPEVAVRSLRRTVIPSLILVQLLFIAARACLEIGDGTERVGTGFVLVGFGVWAVAAGIVIGFRKAARVSILTRRLLLAPFAVCTVVLGHRFMAWHSGVVLAHALEQELVLLGTAMLVVGFTLTRFVLPGAGLFFLAALLVHGFPADARWIAQAAIAAVLALLLLMPAKPHVASDAPGQRTGRG